jgi:hypothetical protein
MADKLNESTWTGFLKKQKLEVDDKGLAKALGAFEKTDESKPESRLDALKEVDAQIAKQVVALAKRKKELGDKPWKEAKEKLDEMLVECGRLTQETRAAMAAQSGALAGAIADTVAALDAVTKALAGAIKIAEDKHDARLEALGKVDEAIAKETVALGRRKKDLGDKRWKEAKDKLDTMLADAERLTQETRAAKDGAEEDDEPGSVLLDPKRLQSMLLRCKRDPELSMNFGFVDAEGKKPAFFAMHPRMSGKKLFATLRTETSARSGAFGTAWVEVDGKFKGTCLMLQLDKPLSGLVKKVKAPVKAAGFKIAKAVLWDADGSVFEQEDEVDDGQGVATAGAAATAPAKTTSPEMTAMMARAAAVLTSLAAAGDALDASQAKDAKLRASESLMNGRKGEWDRAEALMKEAEALVARVKAADPAATSTATATTGDEAMVRGTAKAPPTDALNFRTRLTGMVPLMKPVEAAGGQVADQIKVKRDEAVALVRQKGAGPAEFAKAQALLDDIEALIAGPVGAVTKGGTPKVAAATGAKVVFQQTRLTWDSTRKQVQVDLRKLEEAILAQCKDQPDLQQIAEGTKNLYNILEHLDERLMDKLDDALNAATPEARAELHEEARTIVDEYMDYVKGEELFEDIDDNGFVAVEIASTLNASLGTMAKQLRVAVTA